MGVKHRVTYLLNPFPPHNNATLERGEELSVYSVLSVYSHLCCVELSACPFLLRNSRDPKDTFSSYAFIVNNKVLLYCTVLSYS